MKDPAGSEGVESASSAWHTRAWPALKVALLGLTLEPAILFSNFGRHIVEGNALNLDLLMEKLCVDRFNETQEVCSNLADYPELQDEVQISYNQFETGKKLVGMAPLILYSLVAGALSDKYGRKPIFLVALFGRMMEAAVEFVFYLFKDDISIYFWYCTAIFEFLGGMPMYYLGMHSYGATAATPEMRTTLMSRFVAVDKLSQLLGTFCSSFVTNAFGNLGNYGIKFAALALSIAWVIFLVPEPLQKTKNPESEPAVLPQHFPADKVGCLRRFGGNVKTYIWRPLTEMKTTLFMRRFKNLRMLIYIQLVAVALHYIAFDGVNEVVYLFGSTTFPGFDGDAFSYWKVATSIGNVVILSTFVPVVSGRYHMHDALLTSLIFFITAVGYFLTAFTKELWQFYLTTSLDYFYTCWGACAR